MSIEGKLILAIDFNNMLFGSYYGEKLINSQGINVNAVKGFFFKMQALKNTFNPDYIVIANDLSREQTFRRKLYKPYKAQRKSHDDDIITQMRYALQLVDLIGYPLINNPVYEADDVLGMISKYARDNGAATIIVSTDRDLYQLLDEGTYIFLSKTREILDHKWLKEKYKLTPQQWIELKMLQGDRSDNIPGIPGVGEVSALRLMQQYGSIDSIYKHLNALKPSLRDNLINGKDVLPLTRELVTIITDYDEIGITEQSLEMRKCYIQELYQAIDSMELKSLINVMKYSLLLGKDEGQ
ncbi:MAG: hypothetical protein NC131_11320 [Roseburia sp.]|nr:hypothetical protein [Roseburia sp.]